MDKFESKVKKGGLLLYDDYGIQKPLTRNDIDIYRINAMDTANALDMQKTFNMLVLGGLLKIVPMVTLENVMKGLKKTLPERHYSTLPANEEAIRKGFEIIQKVEL